MSPDDLKVLLSADDCNGQIVNLDLNAENQSEITIDFYVHNGKGFKLHLKEVLFFSFTRHFKDDGAFPVYVVETHAIDKTNRDLLGKLNFANFDKTGQRFLDVDTATYLYIEGCLTINCIFKEYSIEYDN
ncbi:MAG: hypothetical protein ACPGVT_05060 [Maricaulaceae bacterium]